MLSGTKAPEPPASLSSRAKDNDGEKEDGEVTEISEEELHRQHPLMTFADLKFLLTVSEPDVVDDATRKDAETKLVALITQHNMSHYYTALCGEVKIHEDVKLIEQMKTANDKDLKAIDDKIADAEKNAGDSEVREGKLSKANYYGMMGDKVNALKWYDETMEKTVGSGGRIDLIFAVLRMAFALNDLPLIRKNIAKAKSMVEKGGDWERRNLFHVYEAVFLIITREFKDAAKLLLDSVATFTCYPLFGYTQFAFYTVLTAMISLDRVTLRDKIIKSPDVLSVIRDVPHLQDLAFSLYRCQYGQFFKSLAAITPIIKRDRLMSHHFNFYVRELRIVAYQQFLESYRSVTLQSMSAAFGVSETFLDKELARFINAGRLTCKIDKVGGIVETNRPDSKNVQYQTVIKHGDLLLARVQKLTKVVSY